ncbi:hypothetical protein SAMN04487820_102377 [Actinopolyspora mzabensis]|uniref:Uncharacterized protein n=1 Tax=Actinopolyspora mzabensis TaxID=995066 RepID=A0A1G8X418_ACTMZ|nr:hypothetical protein [Actinopolyspora mzabensis]SDJ85379.1 hypothetical protein SAMN04487820_102377 [Actinopolyspora mzabensis]
MPPVGTLLPGTLLPGALLPGILRWRRTSLRSGRLSALLTTRPAVLRWLLSTGRLWWRRCLRRRLPPASLGWRWGRLVPRRGLVVLPGLFSLLLRMGRSAGLPPALRLPILGSWLPVAAAVFGPVVTLVTHEKSSSGTGVNTDAVRCVHVGGCHRP